MSGGTILIADDDRGARRLLEHALSREFKVVAVSDGLEAIQCLRESADYDLLVTDGDMPHVDGYELIEQASALRPDLPCLMVSGSLTDTQRSWLERRGVPCLEKPFRLADLSDAVHRLVSARLAP